MYSDNNSSDFYKKKVNKRNNKKKIYTDIYEEIEIYEIDERNRKYYEGYEHFSQKEKSIFDNKFSKPLNNSQEKYFKLLNNKDKKIITSVGPSGTGKTTLATEVGIRNLLLGDVSKLILVRPTVSVDDEQIGFLPGGLEDKMAPWLRPIYDILYQFISPKEVQSMIENKEIELSPLAYMRGRTFKNCWIVADEMQNSTINQMKMLLTRIGHNTKLIITGDLDQHDKQKNGEINGLEDFINKLRRKRSSSISSVEFSHNDIEREEVVKEVLELYNDDDLQKSSYLNEVLLSSSPASVSSLTNFMNKVDEENDSEDNDSEK
jgi:phosphate starvation-inducible protein PhoH